MLLKKVLQYSAGSFSTSHQEKGVGDISFASESQVSSSETDDLFDMPCGTTSEFIVEKQNRTLRNHRTYSRLPGKIESKRNLQKDDKKDFWVYDNDQFESKTAELKGKNDEAILWVTQDSKEYVTSDDVELYLNEFEKYYEDLKDHFGREPDPKDFSVLENTDGRVNIVLSEMSCAGYFYSADLYSQEMFRHSNEDKVIYINSAYSDPKHLHGQEHTPAVIAHEFQHLLHYNERVLAGAYQTETWINEGFSELAKDVAGYGFYHENPYQQLRVADYMEAVQDVSVIGWQQQSENYGASYLFSRYLYDQYGKDILENILSSPDKAVLAIEEFSGTPSAFWRVFENYSLALLSSSDNGIDLGKPYSFEIDIEDYSPFVPELEPGEGWDNRKIRGWSTGFTEITPGNGGDIEVKIDEASGDGRFRVVAVRY